MIYYPPGGKNAPRVRPDDLTKTGAKRLRRIARAARGRAQREQLVGDERAEMDR